MAPALFVPQLLFAGFFIRTAQVPRYSSHLPLPLPRTPTPYPYPYPFGSRSGSRGCSTYVGSSTA